MGLKARERTLLYFTYLFVELVSRDLRAVSFVTFNLQSTVTYSARRHQSRLRYAVKDKSACGFQSTTNVRSAACSLQKTGCSMNADHKFYF